MWPKWISMNDLLFFNPFIINRLKTRYTSSGFFPSPPIAVSCIHTQKNVAKVPAVWFPVSFSSFGQFGFGQEHSQKSSLDCHTCHTYGYPGGLCYCLRLVDWTRVYCRCVTWDRKMTGELNGTGEPLGGGFKYFLFSPLFGEDFQFD